MISKQYNNNCCKPLLFCDLFIPLSEGMPTARQVPPDLKKYMAKRVSIKMNGNRVVQGRLSGFDLFMNLVLEEAEEIVSGSAERLEVGVMIVRGNSVLQMECLDQV